MNHMTNILIHTEAGVTTLILILNRADKKNAITAAMYSAMASRAMPPSSAQATTLAIS